MKDRVFYDHSRGKYQSDGADWQDYRRILNRIPREVRPWLLDQGSLTRHLQRSSGGQFGVDLLRQRWARPVAHERAILDLKSRELAQVRETLLLVDGEPWVFARSVIPAYTLRGANRRLQYFGSRSLGSWLFQAKNMRRSRFQVAQLAPSCPLVPLELQQTQCLWGRRSRFELSGAPLLVCEIFLPAFRPWPTQ